MFANLHKTCELKSITRMFQSEFRKLRNEQHLRRQNSTFLKLLDARIIEIRSGLTAFDVDVLQQLIENYISRRFIRSHVQEINKNDENKFYGVFYVHRC